MNRQNHRSTFAAGVLATLASVLAIGTPATPNSARTTGNAAQAIDAANPGARKAPTAAIGNQIGGLASLMEHSTGGGIRYYPPNGRKEWGMSRFCHNMRMGNVRKGYVAHYRPRAS